MTAFHYWTWDEIRRFLVDNGLIVAEGMDGNHEVALTGKGEELFGLLAVVKHLGGGVPR